MYVLLIICIIIGILIFLANLSYYFKLRERCTGQVTGRFVYCEWAADINGRYVQGRWNPVFEYQVEDTVYMVELEIMAPSNRFDVDEVEVQYLPSNPEICFIKGTRGKIRSKTNLAADEQ